MEKPIAEHVVGEDRGELVVATFEENCAAVDALVSQARRKLFIFSRDLEPRLYDREPFYAAVKELATYSRYSDIRILIMESDTVIKRGHRLIDLARRLTSYIAIRKVANDYQNMCSAFLVVDEKAYLYRSLATQHEGVVDFDDTNRARELAKLFTEVWEHSQPDPNLRQLHI